MNPDRATLYNKFHIVSIGLRTINRLVNNDEIKKAKRIIRRLMKESDGGMEYIKNIEAG